MGWTLTSRRRLFWHSKIDSHPDRLTLLETRRIARWLGAALGLGLVGVLWKMDSPGGADVPIAALTGLGLAMVVYLTVVFGLMGATRLALWASRRWRAR